VAHVHFGEPVPTSPEHALMAHAVPTGGPMVRLRRWAGEITRDVYALTLAARDPRVPWYAKALALCVAAYAFSPIDLIPDFIPILGLADELVILPLGILLVVALIPRDVMTEHRATAVEGMRRPKSRAAAAVIVAVWLILAAATGWAVWGWYG
jgi:uncharacterized membrane protein YkvA (DUF1232 family)